MTLETLELMMYIAMHAYRKKTNLTMVADVGPAETVGRILCRDTGREYSLNDSRHIFVASYLLVS